MWAGWRRDHMVVTIFHFPIKKRYRDIFYGEIPEYFLSCSFWRCSHLGREKLFFSNYYPGAFIIKTWVGVIVCLPTVRVLQTMSSLSQSSTVRRFRVRFTQNPFWKDYKCSCSEGFCLGFGSHPSLWSSSFLRHFRFGRDRYKNRTDVCLDMYEWNHMNVT